MFIELTDHLRCPVDHDESFLVLLPDKIEGRSVIEGQLGCPVCGRTFQLSAGVFDTGDAPNLDAGIGGRLDADALTALVGLSGPGGYLVLVGAAADQWQDVAALNPGVALAAVNPGPDITDTPRLSVLRSGGSLSSHVRCAEWCWAAPTPTIRTGSAKPPRVVLPGLRIVGEGANPRATRSTCLRVQTACGWGRGKRKSGLVLPFFAFSSL